MLYDHWPSYIHLQIYLELKHIDKVNEHVWHVKCEAMCFHNFLYVFVYVCVFDLF